MFVSANKLHAHRVYLTEEGFLEGFFSYVDVWWSVLIFNGWSDFMSASLKPSLSGSGVKVRLAASWMSQCFSFLPFVLDHQMLHNPSSLDSYLDLSLPKDTRVWSLISEHEIHSPNSCVILNMIHQLLRSALYAHIPNLCVHQKTQLCVAYMSYMPVLINQFLFVFLL